MRDGGWSEPTYLYVYIRSLELQQRNVNEVEKHIPHVLTAS